MKIVVYSNLADGGAKQIMLRIAKELKKNHEIHAISPVKKIRFINFIHYLYYIYFLYPKINASIANKIKIINPELVLLSHDYLTKSPIVLQSLVNTIYICHEEPREFYDDSRYLNSKIKYKLVNLFRLPLKYIDYINVKRALIVLSNSRYSQHKLTNIYKRPIDILPMAIPLHIRPYITERNNYYLTIGSTSKFKGVDFLIQSISMLPSEYRHPLIIVGNVGRDHEYIINLAYKLNVKLIHRNNINNKQINKLYNSSLLLLAAAHNEPFGLSIIEALRCKLPVVAVNEGGYRETIDNFVIKNYSGYITNRSEVDFSNAIIKALKTNHNNSDKVSEYIKNKYNWESTMKKLNNIINTL